MKMKIAARSNFDGTLETVTIENLRPDLTVAEVESTLAEGERLFGVKFLSWELVEDEKAEDD